MAKECRIHNDDVILVTVGVILPLLCGRVLPMWPESGTTTGFGVEILTKRLPEPPLNSRRIPVSHRCEGASSKITDNTRRIIRGSQASRSNPHDARQQDESRQQ
jgi:hypothetical protein